MRTLRSRLRIYIIVVLLAVFSAGAYVTLDALWTSWPSACEQSQNVIWQWVWNCPDIPSGGGGGGGW